jgi:hypothetical protein
MSETGKEIVKTKNIKGFIKSKYFLKSFLGLLIGGTAGFLYYRFIGCSTGSCIITSHPYSAIFAGGLTGYLISGIF